jgi:hypothetical protein
MKYVEKMPEEKEMVGPYTIAIRIKIKIKYLSGFATLNEVNDSLNDALGSGDDSEILFGSILSMYPDLKLEIIPSKTKNTKSKVIITLFLDGL